MSDHSPVLSMEGVSKKFRRGELYASLRGTVAGAIAKAAGRRIPGELRNNEFWALRDVSFNVQRGEALGIIGSNGAGKSTILKLLSGIIRPTHGIVGVRGRLSALIEVGAGFHPDLTGRENVFLNGTILGMTRDEIRRKFDSIVDFAGVGAAIDTPAKRFSSGMYARLGFSVAAHVEPDLLIVDEVLSVGDYLFQQKCLTRMTEIMHSGTTVLFVSHNLHAVSELCQRSVLLEKGRLIARGPSNEVIRQYVERAQNYRPDEGEKVNIRTVVLRNQHGRTAKFDPKEKALIDVVSVAQREVDDLSIVIQVVDDNFYPIFETSSARLNGNVGPRLAVGEAFHCTFDLDLCFGAGTYHVNVYARAHSTDEPLGMRRLAASFFVGGMGVIRGVVNLNPRLDDYEIRHAALG